MVLRIRDNKERVNLFLEYFDCTYEVKPRTPFNQPDVLTMNFYYALKLFCKNYNEIYDAPHHWKDKIPALFTGYKMLFESKELKVSFISCCYFPCSLSLEWFKRTRRHCHLSPGD